MFVKRFFENYFLASAKPACRADFGCDFFCVYALIYVGNGGNIHEFLKIRIEKNSFCFFCTVIFLYLCEKM